MLRLQRELNTTFALQRLSPTCMDECCHGFTADKLLGGALPLWGNLSLDWEFQHLFGKIWGIEEFEDFLEKLHFLG